MISSMTGFGRGELKENGYLIVVELRSLNHRFLEIDIRIPKSLSDYEIPVKELISANVSRGRINAFINIKGDNLPAPALTIDKALATTYVELCKQLKDQLKLEGDIKLEQLLNLPDIVTFENSNQLDKKLWRPVKKTVKLAIQDLKEMRSREGLEISKDLQLRINFIQKLIKKIESYTKKNSKVLFNKLREKIQAIADPELINEGRLETEIALLAEKADVTEECIRFKSHNTLFKELLENGEPEGRKLNFLLQEMHREANTIGAKANDAQIAHWVVDIKDEVEKLREQIQNIE